jgi:hypothetical protein
MDISLKPPQDKVVEYDDQRERLEASFESGSVKLSDDKRHQLEKKLRKMVDRWKEGTSVLRDRLQKNNDMMEGIVDEMDFPWPGASKVSMGVGAGQARTLAATFDRALFSAEQFLCAENTAAMAKAKARTLEEAVNWLCSHDNNLLDTLRDMPIPLFRDGTIPVMGEWRRDIEKAVDYRTYQTSEEFMSDYPSPETAGISEKRYNDIIKFLDETYNPDLCVEYVYDEVVYDAPFFSKIPLARFLFYPLSAEDLKECVAYGRQFFEGTDIVEAKIAVGEYDEEPGKEAIAAAKGMADDIWGSQREAIEGLASSGDDYKRCEFFRIVLKMDLDEDGIQEKYLLTYENTAKRIVKFQRYKLRKNIDNVVLFRFLKRDGRILGVSLMGDGYDMFRMVDDFHRHRQNVRSITDAPAFICPDDLKDQVDFGSGAYAWRPGVTIYLPERFMEEGKAPRQLAVQNLSQDANSLDEESSVMRYMEIRLGPSQGMSGKETMNDPKAPATKTLALLRQSTFRTDAYITEFKRSVPDLVTLCNALYYQYGQREIPYMTRVKGEPFQANLKKELMSEDALVFKLKIGELSLSPEFQMEKAMSILQNAMANPLVMQLKPQIAIEAWNEFVQAVKPLDPQRFMLDTQTPGQPQMPPLMGQMMPEVPTILAEKLKKMSGGKNGDKTDRRSAGPKAGRNLSSGIPGEGAGGASS